MLTLKKPEFENDDYLIRLDPRALPSGPQAIETLRRLDPIVADYYETKRRAFSRHDTNPQIFERFVDDKPSLRCLSELSRLDSTIYTVACELENGLSHAEIIGNIKKHLAHRPMTRRCALRLINDYNKYFLSETAEPADVTCLSLIHYLSDGPKLIFRASDIKNELLVDILTINEFFISPVYDSAPKKIEMSIYSSTAQGVSDWNNFVKYLEAVGDV